MSDSFYELAVSEDEAAEQAAAIAVQVAETLNEIVDLFGVDAVEWIRAELVKHLPVVHAMSRWQRVLGRLGFRATAWCGERIVAGCPAGPVRECRECRRAVDGER
jgi:hypothetical protein